ncbi:D-glycero-beta-D-manno-heptose-1,7-bisphosphate 7-phosphatase [subsurface metagenome]
MFIDRDGTINKDVPYCGSPEDFELLPGAAKGIKLLNRHDFKVVVITNQSGIARGYFTEEMLTRIHNKMHSELAKCRAHVDAIYHCPHHPDDNCDCRKPGPKLVFQAALDLNIALEQSYVIGDSGMDIEMGRKAGCRTILICAGKESQVSTECSVMPDYKVPSVILAAQHIIADAS